MDNLAGEALIAVVVNDLPGSKTVEWLTNRFTAPIANGGPEIRVHQLDTPQFQETTMLLLDCDTDRLLIEAEYTFLRKPTSNGDVLPFVRVPQSRDIKFGDFSTLLASSERIRLVMQIMSRMRVNNQDHEFYRNLIKGEPLISELTVNHVVGDIFPLHDNAELHKLGMQWYAAKLTVFEPSYDSIRDYFGEKVGMYFAFLGFYTKALVLPSCLALYNCLLWYNYEAVHAQAPFAAFNLIYLTIFLKVWKRRCSSLAYRWGMYGSERYETARPGFKGTLQLSPITRELEIAFPQRTRYRIMFCETYPLVFVCLIVAVLAMWAYYICQLWVEKVYAVVPSSWLMYFFEQILMLNIPTIVYSILIEISNRWYKKLAQCLTSRENHRLQSEHEYHLLCKLILFQSVNCFGWLFYTAFVLQEMDRLRRYLATTLITMQILQQVQECVIPFLRVYFSKQLQLKRMSKTQSSIVNDILIESKLDIYEDTFDDYLEMWLQFGYAFMFSSVFPMAAFCAFANNLLEMRSDAFKLCTTMRRPFPQPAESAGIWQSAFNALIIISVMTNCALLGMVAGTSKKFADWTPSYIVLLFVVVEHAILFLQYVVSNYVQDIPEHVRIRVARSEHIISSLDHTLEVHKKLSS